MRESVGGDEVTGVEIGAPHLVPSCAGPILRNEAGAQAAEASIIDDDVEAAKMANNIVDEIPETFMVASYLTLRGR